MNGEFREEGRRPGDERAFFHKKLLKALPGVATKFLGGAVEGIGTKLFGGGGRPTSTIPVTFAPTKSFAGATPGGGDASMVSFVGGGNGAGPCKAGTYPDAKGRCVSPSSPYGARQLMGQAIMGLYGPAVAPEEVLRSIAVCPTGFALGKDGLCYDGLANRKRKYPRGRRPLLTGGDMRSITRARSAGIRLANAKSDLVAIGMLKAATPKRRKKKAVPCA